MPHLIRASVTDVVLNPIVNAATDFISSTGLPAVFLLMALESACIPVPSEAVMLFAGFSVSSGDLTLIGIIVAGVLGNLVGSWIAYAAGYYGDATVFFSRMLPIIRTFISLPAGVARMPFWRFSVLTLAGCIPWVTMLALVGRAVGDNWEEWREHLHYLDYAVVTAIVALVVYFIVKRRRGAAIGEGVAEAD